MMILPRFTRDVIAQAVHTQIAQGDVTPKLLFRFYRAGRRDGRRGTDPAITRNIIADAVDSACSYVSLGYHERLGELQTEEAKLNEEVRVLRKQSDNVDGPEPVAGATGSTGDSASTDQEFSDALTARRKKGHDRKIAGLTDQIQQRTIRLSEIDGERNASHRSFLEQIVKAQTQGQSVWDRYTLGVHEGLQRSGSDISVEDPLPFKDPETYLGDREIPLSYSATTETRGA